MATGALLIPRTHSVSHWVSWGQTRPVTAGRALSAKRLSAAEEKSPFATKSMKRGMFIMTGQPAMHRGSLHWRQRWASRRASFSVKPKLTSAKFRLRSAASCSGIV